MSELIAGATGSTTVALVYYVVHRVRLQRDLRRMWLAEWRR